MAKAEYHEKVAMVSAGGITSVMHAIYTGIANQVTALGSNAVIKFVVEDSNTAIHNGTTFATPAGTSFWQDNSYMVIEPSASYPGGGKWQLRISAAADGNDVEYELSPSGGWQSSDNTFDGVESSGTIDTFGAGGSSVSGVDFVWVSMANRDTYDNGAKSYSYIRVLLEASGADPAGGLYAGGYIPFQHAQDTKPVCALSGEPNAAEGNDHWTCASVSTSNNHNRVPVQYDHGAAMTGNASLCSPVHIDELVAGAGDDRSGKLAATTIYLKSHDSHLLGAFGPYTFKSFKSLAAWLTDSSDEYITARGFLHRWKAGATVES